MGNKRKRPQFLKACLNCQLYPLVVNLNRNKLVKRRGKQRAQVITHIQHDALVRGGGGRPGGRTTVKLICVALCLTWTWWSRTTDCSLTIVQFVNTLRQVTTINHQR